MTSFKKRFADILSRLILAIAMCLIGVLSIPIFFLLLPIVLIWTITNKMFRLLERI